MIAVWGRQRNRPLRNGERDAGARERDGRPSAELAVASDAARPRDATAGRGSRQTVSNAWPRVGATTYWLNASCTFAQFGRARIVASQRRMFGCAS